MPDGTDLGSRPNSAVALHHAPHRPMSPTQLASHCPHPNPLATPIPNQRPLSLAEPGHNNPLDKRAITLAEGVMRRPIETAGIIGRARPVARAPDLGNRYLLL
jgi:hypothetical protein